MVKFYIQKDFQLESVAIWFRIIKFSEGRIFKS